MTHFNRFTLLLVGCPLAVSLATQAQISSISKVENEQTIEKKFAQITYSRTGCFGTCPVYKLTISADGTVQYEGEKYVKVKGKAITKLSPQQLQQLMAAIDTTQYFSLRDSYQTEADGCPITATDCPTVRTSVTVNGQVKSITHYLGCWETKPDGSPKWEAIFPRNLTRFEERIDEIVGTARWVDQ